MQPQAGAKSSARDDWLLLPTFTTPPRSTKAISSPGSKRSPTQNASKPTEFKDANSVLKSTEKVTGSVAVSCGPESIASAEMTSASTHRGSHTIVSDNRIHNT